MRGAPWPEADRLFRSDPRWIGGDAAYSVPIDDHRTLWVFGDTFIDVRGTGDRRDAVFVHNTVGIQDGTDPSTASITFHTGGTWEDPTPVFASEPGTWLWPMDVARLPQGVVVFFMRVRSSRPDLPSIIDAWREEGALRFFEVFDWTAAFVPNPQDPPSAWDIRMLPTPPAVNRIMPGAGAVVHDGHLYAYGWRDGHELRPGWIRRRPRYRGHHRPRLAFVLRWPVDRVPEGLRDPEWWCGGGWSLDAARAVEVVDDPATEFTVDERDGRFLLVGASPWLPVVDDVPWFRGLRVLKRLPKVGRTLQFLRVMKTSVTLRWADAPQGPWTAPRRAYTPDVPQDVHVYAGKGHPQLGGADLICTYMRIAFKVDRTLDDDGLYRPGFVRVTL